MSAEGIALTGPNGAGKTNWLEAVAVLCTLRSFRDDRTRHWVRSPGGEVAEIVAEVEDDRGGVLRARAAFGAGGRLALELDGSAVERVEVWAERLAAISFVPTDTEFVRGEPQGRRRVVDRAIFTVRPSYLELARTYQRLLRHKTALLREPVVDPLELRVWNERLVEAAVKMVEARRAFLRRLEAPVSELARDLSGESIRWRWTGLAACQSDLLEELWRRLGERGEEERRRGLCLVGPHRDDLVVEIDGRPGRAFASQGQARTAVLVWKLAELRAAVEQGVRPVFLLDAAYEEFGRFDAIYKYSLGISY